MEQGLDVVKEWLFGVLHPYAEEAYLRVRAEHGLGDPHGKLKQLAAHQAAVAANTSININSINGLANVNGSDIKLEPGEITPPPKSNLPIHLTAAAAAAQSASAKIPLRPAIDSGHLSFINQYFSQQGKYIDWRFLQAEGSKTTPVWVVEAHMDGVKIGSGKAPTKKGAKNEAARQALEQMGVVVMSFPFPLPLSSHADTAE